jgi:hypothetical protein
MADMGRRKEPHSAPEKTGGPIIGGLPGNDHADSSNSMDAAMTARCGAKLIACVSVAVMLKTTADS